MTILTKINALRFFSPIRIIEIISLLSLVPIFQINWQSEVIIFNAFFLTIAGSIIFEAVWDKDGFRSGLKKTAWKYYSGISIQFVGAAVSALASFNTDPTKLPTIVMYSLLLIGIGGCLEAFHIFSTKKLKNVILSPLQQVLAVFGFTIVLLILSLYTFFEVIPRTSWF